MKKRKLLGGALALALGVAAMATATPAPPAEAATATYGAFEIFYGPNCGAGGTASRVYNQSWLSTQYGEPWINDTFNSKRFGSKGYGQKIKNNAASVWVERGTVTFTFYGNGKYYSVVIGTDKRFNGGMVLPAKQCINFDDVTTLRSLMGARGEVYRNHNTHFFFLKV